MINPNHIAIIMDGNSRWGKKNFNSIQLGHQNGVKNIKPIIKLCLSKKIKNLTLFALSYDNLKKRKKKEIQNIFSLFDKYLSKNINYFIENKITLNFIGELHELPKNILKKILNVKTNTRKKNNKLLINVALNYSSKKEILNVLKILNKKKLKINEKNFNKSISTHYSGDPEIIIRTGGFYRLSDFLLWQSSYSELFFLKKLWPDFTTTDLNKIINKFKKIKRNFGS